MQALVHAHIVTMNEKMDVIRDGYILYNQDGIFEIGKMSDYRILKGVVAHDVNGKIVMPGLVNAHTHLGLVAFRSMGDDVADRLRKMIFPLEKEFMNESLTEVATRYGAYESLLNGTTTVGDMYYYSDIVAHVLEDVGIRALVGQTIIDESQIDYESSSAALYEAEKFICEWKSHPLIRPMLAPHGTTTVSKEMIQHIHQVSKKHNVKVMMHVAEMDYEMEELLPQTPFEYLDSLGVLDHNFIAVHAIHTQEKDHELIKQNKVGVVHCPGANMKAGKGIASIYEMAQKDVLVSLGTDGPISGNTLDVMSVMKLAAIAQKTKYHLRDIMPCKEILKMATIDGARVLGLGDVTGSIEIGKQADIIVIDINSVNMFPIHDVYAALVYQLQPQNIDTVIVGGVVKVKHHQIRALQYEDTRKKLSDMIHTMLDN